MTGRALAAVLTLLLAVPATPVPAETRAETRAETGAKPRQQAADTLGTDAALAIEEARLRARIVLALAVAESVRLRGRTILVAMSEIERVRARIATLDAGSDRRAEFDARLAALEARRVELDGEVDEEFLSYLALVSELAGALWTRVDRVGDDVSGELEALAMRRLTQVYPVLRAHIEEFSRAGGVGRDVTARWRREIDDTYDMRRAREGTVVPAEPAAPDAAADAKTEKDI